MPSTSIPTTCCSGVEGGLPVSCRLHPSTMERSGVWWSARVHGFSRFAPAGAAWRACRCALAARVHGFSRFALFFSRIDRGKDFFLARFRLNARLSSDIEANQSVTPRKTGKSVQAHRLGPRTRKAVRWSARVHRFSRFVPAGAAGRTRRPAHLLLRACRLGAAAFRGRGAGWGSRQVPSCALYAR